ncbi:CYTH domain-containing protein [Parabacteroides sp. PF5-9]|uniref:CYTH domain-containing protein n=1 Tax=Parabacteroides sp. PF5-9 TaxID=1742404 RepID=UPI0024738DB9|nr:CYTH domain-containing protein [Parabacteroides sp. PF5-9]MDH6358459.1 adenylate cyclase [Parabacteroides sp. PF5-9]
MATEIERKFLVKGDFKKNCIQIKRIKQGYICALPNKTVRIRLTDEKGFLTIKGASDEKGLTRYEFEQEVAIKDAEDLFELCEPGRIDKTRHLVKEGDHVWEVDEFHGENEGLILAEIELTSEEDSFEIPEWVGKEVTGDLRYYNAMLTQNPYTQWEEKLNRK